MVSKTAIGIFARTNRKFWKKYRKFWKKYRRQKKVGIIIKEF